MDEDDIAAATAARKAALIKAKAASKKRSRPDVPRPGVQASGSRVAKGKGKEMETVRPKSTGVKIVLARKRAAEGVPDDSEVRPASVRVIGGASPDVISRGGMSASGSQYGKNCSPDLLGVTEKWVRDVASSSKIAGSDSLFIPETSMQFLYEVARGVVYSARDYQKRHEEMTSALRRADTELHEELARKDNDYAELAEERDQMKEELDQLRIRYEEERKSFEEYRRGQAKRDEELIREFYRSPLCEFAAQKYAAPSFARYFYAGAEQGARCCGFDPRKQGDFSRLNMSQNGSFTDWRKVPRPSDLGRFGSFSTEVFAHFERQGGLADGCHDDPFLMTWEPKRAESGGEDDESNSSDSRSGGGSDADGS